MSIIHSAGRVGIPKAFRQASCLVPGLDGLRSQSWDSKTDETALGSYEALKSAHILNS